MSEVAELVGQINGPSSGFLTQSVVGPGPTVSTVEIAGGIKAPTGQFVLATSEPPDPPVIPPTGLPLLSDLKGLLETAEVTPTVDLTYADPPVNAYFSSYDLLDEQWAELNNAEILASNLFVLAPFANSTIRTKPYLIAEAGATIGVQINLGAGQAISDPDDEIPDDPEPLFPVTLQLVKALGGLVVFEEVTVELTDTPQTFEFEAVMPYGVTSLELRVRNNDTFNKSIFFGFCVMTTSEGEGDVIPPEFLTGAVDGAGTSATIVFNEPIQGEGGFKVFVDGVLVVPSQVVASGSTITAAVPQVYTGETVTLEYDDTVGSITDIAGNALASFGPVALTNNSVVEQSESVFESTSLVDGSWNTVDGAVIVSNNAFTLDDRRSSRLSLINAERFPLIQGSTMRVSVGLANTGDNPNVTLRLVNSNGTTTYGEAAIVTTDADGLYFLFVNIPVDADSLGNIMIRNDETLLKSFRFTSLTVELL